MAVAGCPRDQRPPLPPFASPAPPARSLRPAPSRPVPSRRRGRAAPTVSESVLRCWKARAPKTKPESRADVLSPSMPSTMAGRAAAAGAPSGRRRQGRAGPGRAHGLPVRKQRGREGEVSGARAAACPVSSAARRQPSPPPRPLQSSLALRASSRLLPGEAQSKPSPFGLP